MSEWYYLLRDEQCGPVAGEALRELARLGTIGPGTLIWREGLDDWRPASEVQDLSLEFSAVGPAPPRPGAVAARHMQAIMTYTEKGFRSLWLWFLILYIVGVVLTIVIIGIFALIAAVVLQYIMLYRYWKLIQDGHARCTPGTAVGFLFIPFFNLYWVFRAIHGLALDMNQYCGQRGIATRGIPEGLALAMCILVIVSIIPYLGLIAGLANMVIIPMLWYRFNETGIAILANHQGGDQGSGYA